MSRDVSSKNRFFSEKLKIFSSDLGLGEIEICNNRKEVNNHEILKLEEPVITEEIIKNAQIGDEKLRPIIEKIKAQTSDTVIIDKEEFTFKDGKLFRILHNRQLLIIPEILVSRVISFIHI